MVGQQADHRAIDRQALDFRQQVALRVVQRDARCGDRCQPTGSERVDRCPTNFGGNRRGQHPSAERRVQHERGGEHHQGEHHDQQYQ